MKILFSAYSCGATKVSEPGNAWRIVNYALSRGHEVWTITEREVYEKELMAHLAGHPLPGYHPVFFELPPPLTFFRRPGMLKSVYYHLWQQRVAAFARQLHEKIGFDLAHHITFGRYWTPSGVRNLGIPFVWGPVGAAESAPRGFLGELPMRERALEFMRDSARHLCHLDPALRDTARRATISLGVTPESCEAIRQLGGPRAEQMPQGALDKEDLDVLGRVPAPPSGPFRALCLGRLVHWKGFYLAICAFALFARKNPEAELWIAGGGPFQRELEQTAARSGVASRIRFLGALSHAAAMEKLAEAHVLVHPALHEAFGNVCLEAMAAGRPVVCLGVGGPAVQVTAQTGLVVPATTPDEAVTTMADFLARISDDRELLLKLSAQARAHVRANFTMRKIGGALDAVWAEAVASQAGGPRRSS